MNPAATLLPAVGRLTLGALTPPGASRVASFFIAPERGQYAFAIFAARSFVRSKGIGGAARPLGKLTNWSPLKFPKSHTSHKLAGKSRSDFPDLFPGLHSFVVISCVSLGLHVEKHAGERAKCTAKEFPKSEKAFPRIA